MYLSSDRERLYNSRIETYPIDVEPPPAEFIEKQETQPERLPLYKGLERPGPLNEWMLDTLLPALPSRVLQIILGLTVRGDRVVLYRKPQFLHFDFPNGRTWTPAGQALLAIGGDSCTDVLEPFRGPEDANTALSKIHRLHPRQSYPPMTFIWSPDGPFAHGRGASLMTPEGVQVEGKRFAYDFAVHKNF